MPFGELEAEWISSVAADVAGNIHVGGKNGTFVSHDRGQTWSSMRPLGDPVEVSAIAPDPWVDGRVFLATDAGARRSDDAGFDWTPINDGLRAFRGDEIDVDPEDPQVVANDYVVEFEHPQFGPTKMMGLPVALSETPGRLRAPAPELGQHTEEILLDVLGYDWDRISALRDRQVI